MEGSATASVVAPQSNQLASQEPSTSSRQETTSSTAQTVYSPHGDPSQPYVTFSGSSALGGTDLDDDDEDDLNKAGSNTFNDDRSGNQGHPAGGAASLAPPSHGHSSSRRSPSPVGPIGGHRSPVVAPTAGEGTSTSSTFTTSDVNQHPHPIRSVSPWDPPAFTIGSSPLTQKTDAASAFASAPSPVSLSHLDQQHQHQQGRASPFGDRTSQAAQQHNFPDPAARSSTASPAPSAPSERPSSRLDFSKLQQRSNAAAAAQALAQAHTQAQARTRSPAYGAPPHRSDTLTPASTSLQTTPKVSGNDGEISSPQLVQPRPGMPGRTFSESSHGAASLASVPTDQLSPLSTSGLVGTDSGLNSAMTAVSLKSDGYPFPMTTQPQSFAAMNIIDRLNNSSRASHRAPSRTLSPMDPSRLRFGSPAPSMLDGHRGDADPARRSGGGFSSDGSPADLARRILGMESAIEELTKGLTSVARNVGWLMEREKERERLDHSSAQHSAQGESRDEIRMLGSQLSALSTSVQQLMVVQQQQQIQGAAAGPNGPQGPASNLAGLGLSGGTPQMGVKAPQAQNGPYLSTPTLTALPGPVPGTGPVPGAGSHMAGTSPQFPNGAFNPSNLQSASHPNNAGASPFMAGPPEMRGISPRPGTAGQTGPRSQNWAASPSLEMQGRLNANNAQERRWSQFPPAAAMQNRRESVQVHPGQGATGTPSMGIGAFGAAGTQDLSSVIGPMPPPDANVVVTKWDHLNLQPDLLRSILKYGLGPPNKIQQRALPFLLRGSDIIAQAPPTQERIASYVIPALQLILNTLRSAPLVGTAAAHTAGPFVLMVSTTVDQATQAQRMALGLGSPLGVRVHIAAGTSADAMTEAQNVMQARPHIVVGTPTKMSELFTCLANLRSPGLPNLGDVKMVVLDEVDQMIARNLSDHVGTLLRVLPPVSTGSTGSSLGAPNMGPGGGRASPMLSPGLPPSSSGSSPFNNFDRRSQQQPGRNGAATPGLPPDRQTAIFSNTVPQDVLNFAQSIHLRESVRVLVRREGTSVTQHGPNTGNSNAINSQGGGGSNGGSGSTLTNAQSLHSSSQQPMHQQQQHSPNQVHSSSNHANSVAPPSNALGSTATYALARQAVPLSADPTLSALKGLRQYYLYIAALDPAPSSGSGFSYASNSGNEMKLDLVTDLLEDMEFSQVVVYTASPAALEAVTYKLASRGIESVALHRDMANITRQQALTKFRSPVSSTGGNNAGSVGRGAGRPQRKALVAYDVAIQPRDVHQVPLIVFYDLPRSVDEYKEKLSCGAAGAGGMARPSVCINLVTGQGGRRGDIEMLRTLESHLGFRAQELPMDAKSLLNL